MGSAAHFGRIYWCGKRPAEEAYNGPFLSWLGGLACQYEPCPSPGCEASWNHQRQDPRLCHQRHLREGQLRSKEHQVCGKPFLPRRPLFELAIMRDPLAITTFLRSRSARSNNLITGSAKEVTYSACSQHAARLVFYRLPHVRTLILASYHH